MIVSVVSSSVRRVLLPVKSRQSLFVKGEEGFVIDLLRLTETFRLDPRIAVHIDNLSGDATRPILEDLFLHIDSSSILELDGLADACRRRGHGKRVAGHEMDER